MKPKPIISEAEWRVCSKEADIVSISNSFIPVFTISSVGEHSFWDLWKRKFDQATSMLVTVVENHIDVLVASLKDVGDRYD